MIIVWVRKGSTLRESMLSADGQKIALMWKGDIRLPMIVYDCKFEGDMLRLSSKQSLSTMKAREMTDEIGEKFQNQRSFEPYW